MDREKPSYEELEKRIRELEATNEKLLKSAESLPDTKELKNAEDSLREREEHFRAVIDGSNDGYWDWEIATGNVWFNSRWAEMLGYSLDEIDMHVSTWERLLHPDDESLVLEKLDDLMEGRSDIYQVEHRSMSKTGEWKWVLDRGKIVKRDTDGNPLRIAGTHTDITLQKENEQHINRLIRRLKTANEEISNLINMVAHDIKSPLITISGFTDILIDECSELLDVKFIDYMKRINHAAVSMMNMINFLISYSQIGKFEDERKYFDFNEIVSDAVDSLKFEITSRGITLNIIESPARLFCHKDMLQEALSNILSNAVNYTDRNNNHPEIEIGVKIIDDKDVMYVRDNGIGINPEELKNIFLMFTRGGETNDTAGQGVGLAVAKRIIELHGGRIWAESTPGEGSTFYFTLDDRGQ